MPFARRPIRPLMFVSALCALLIAAEWVRSTWRADVFQRNYNDRQYALTFHGGLVEIDINTDNYIDHPCIVTVDRPWSYHGVPGLYPFRWWSFLADSMTLQMDPEPSGALPNSITMRQYGMPLWLFSVAFAVPPLLYFRFTCRRPRSGRGFEPGPACASQSDTGG